MKKVAQYDRNTGTLLAVYDSQSKAARAIGGRQTAISKAILGENSTAYGYLWAYWSDSPTYKMGNIDNTQKYKMEKRVVMDRLRKYRKENGLGCFNRLACRGITSDEIRQMLAGTFVPIEKWRSLGKALDRDEKRILAQGEKT